MLLLFERLQKLLGILFLIAWVVLDACAQIAMICTILGLTHAWVRRCETANKAYKLAASKP